MWTRGEWTRLQKLADDLPETSVPCCADLRTSVFFCGRKPGRRMQTTQFAPENGWEATFILCFGLLQGWNVSFREGKLWQMKKVHLKWLSGCASTMHQHWVEMGMSTSSLENTPHKNEFPLTCAHWNIFAAPDFKTHALSCRSITTLVDDFSNKADNIRIISTTSPGI